MGCVQGAFADEAHWLELRRCSTISFWRSGHCSSYRTCLRRKGGNGLAVCLGPWFNRPIYAGGYQNGYSGSFVGKKAILRQVGMVDFHSLSLSCTCSFPLGFRWVFEKKQEAGALCCSSVCVFANSSKCLNCQLCSLEVAASASMGSAA